MITFSILRKKLPQYHFECFSKKDTLFYYCNVLIEHAVCKSNTLYIGYSRHLQSCYLNDSTIGFLLLDKPHCDISQLESVFIFANADTVNIMELYHDVQCVFEESVTYLNKGSLFIDAFLQEKSIPELIEISSQLLGNPIMLTNSSFKILYMSKDQMVDDKVWIDAQNLGCCSAESIRYFKNDKASQMLFEGDKSFIYNTGLGKDMPRILKKLSSHHKTIGYFVVFEVNHKLEKNHLEMTDFLCDFLVLQMKHNSTEYTTDKIYENLIIDLLQNKNLSELSITDRIHSSNWSIRSTLRLICIEVDTLRTLTYYFDYLNSQLLYINPYAKAVRYEGNILVVLNYNNTEEYETIFKKLKKLLQVYRLYLGISNPFTNLTDMYDHYIQSKTALTLGKLLQAKDCVFYYKDYSFFHMLSSMDKRNLPGLCSSHYLLLEQYDKANSTEYCETLYQYITAANNVSAAAKALQIHRNTMTYRLEKIVHVSGINLSDGEELFQFYTTAKIVYWMKQLT